MSDLDRTSGRQPTVPWQSSAKHEVKIANNGKLPPFWNCANDILLGSEQQMGSFFDSVPAVFGRSQDNIVQAGEPNQKLILSETISNNRRRAGSAV
jgi:hypothetical protein